MSFVEYKLSDVLGFFNGKAPPKERGGKLPIFGSNGQIGWSDKYNHEAAIVIGRVGAYCGSVQICRGKFWASDNTIVVKPKDDNDLSYFYYKLNSLPLRGFAGGAAQPLLTQGVLKSIKAQFSIPSEQKKIAIFLKNYDDLIENNKRRIALLEESARQLYKEWFVRFRFPGHEHVKIVDGVPEGWVRKPLAELAHITMGQSPKSEFYNKDGEGLPFHQGVTKFGFRFVEHDTYCTKPSRVSEKGDILFSVRAPVGRVNITTDVIAIGRGLSAIRSKNKNQSFLFYSLKSVFFKEDMIGGGAIYASVTKKDLQSQEILVPDYKLEHDFNEFAKSVDKQIQRLHQTNVNLTAARDLLLPKLMSGELAV